MVIMRLESWLPPASLPHHLPESIISNRGNLAVWRTDSMRTSCDPLCVWLLDTEAFTGARMSALTAVVSHHSSEWEMVVGGERRNVERELFHCC